MFKLICTRQTLCGVTDLWLVSRGWGSVTRGRRTIGRLLVVGPSVTMVTGWRRAVVRGEPSEPEGLLAPPPSLVFLPHGLNEVLTELPGRTQALAVRVAYVYVEGFE